MPSKKRIDVGVLPQSALIVDTDTTVLELIKNHLKSLGVNHVVICSDGTEAWQEYQNKPFDLVVMDWKLPGLSGIGLFNRIRQHPEQRGRPILAISGLLIPADFALLQELPCTGFLPKPFSQSVFQRDLETLQEKYRWYANNVDQVNTILHQLPRGGGKAIKALKKIMANAPDPVPIALIAAARLRVHEYLPEAEALLRQILAIDPDSVIAHNELGKVLHLMGKHEEALAALESATRISPKNLERLCLTGEVQLNLGNPAEARSCFREVLEIDPQSKKALAGIQVLDSVEEHLHQQGNEAIPHQYASLLNTTGIAKIRAGKFEEGVKSYRAALAFLHSRDTAARLAFNLGLAYLRWKKKPEALPWFIQAYQLSDRQMLKAKKYIIVLCKVLNLDLDSAVKQANQDAQVNLAPSMDTDASDENIELDMDDDSFNELGEDLDFEDAV